MNDRKLLELAAKAAGHGVEFDDASGLTFMDTKHAGILWSPLHNDGDALRLAVALRLVPLFDEFGVNVMHDGTLVTHNGMEKYDTDPYAATRRAITRAAAALGGAL